ASQYQGIPARKRGPRRDFPYLDIKDSSRFDPAPLKARKRSGQLGLRCGTVDLVPGTVPARSVRRW
ncbi:hypothetical protein, partial [Mycolicibacter minnesotensis]